MGRSSHFYRGNFSFSIGLFTNYRYQKGTRAKQKGLFIGTEQFQPEEECLDQLIFTDSLNPNWTTHHICYRF